MLEVELDIFSGRPNPVWTLTEKEEKELLDRVLANPLQIAPVHSDEYLLGLGYRGLIVRMLKPDDGPWSRTQLSSGTPLPQAFRVGISLKSEQDTMDWLLKTSEQPDTQVADFVRDATTSGVQVIHNPGHTIEQQPGTEGFAQSCGSSYLYDNRGAFNQSSYIGVNNCYCFASNHLTNARYARPGCRGGRPARDLSREEMNAGLVADGWSGSCQSSNNLNIALVVWPGVDFHFYRLVSTSGYRWAHKPGATAARDTDNSGRVISNPETCNRGNYTSFRGYWFQNNSTALVAAC